MDPSLSVDITLKDDQLAVGLGGIARKEEQVEEGLEKIAKEADHADRSLARFAKRTQEINALPAERYEQQMRKLDTALKAGLISQETYNRAVARAKDHLEAAGRAQQATAGSAAVSQLTSVASAWVGISQAIGLATEALQFQKQRTADALSSMKALADARIQLNTVAGAAGEATAEKMAGQYGVDRRQAYDFTLQAANLGFSGSADYVASRHAAIGNLAGVSDVLGTVPGQLGISQLEAINMAGSISDITKLDVAGISPILAQGSEGAKEIGASPEEVMATVGLLSSRYATPQKAGTDLGSFMVKMGLHPEMRGLGLRGVMDKLQAMPEEKRRKEYLKDDKETNVLFNKFGEIESQLPALIASQAHQRAIAGTDQDWLTQKNATNLTNPKIAANIAATKAAALLEQSGENRFATSEAGRASAQKNVTRLLDTQGRAGGTVWAANRSMDTAALLGFGERETAFAGVAGGSATRSLSDIASTAGGSIVAALLGAARSQQEASAELRAAAADVRASLTGNRSRAVSAAAAAPAQ